MEKIIKLVEKSQLNEKIKDLDLSVGDTVKVHLKVTEGDKTRIQIFEGIVLSVRGVGIGKTVKIRKISFGIGVEKTFLIHSPVIDKFEVTKKGAPRRAKLFYLRDRVGKRALKVKGKAVEIKKGAKKEVVKTVKKTPTTPKVTESETAPETN